jgi:3-isopropylmalate/(R)-2-methylmalate dehydratase small subunit
MDPLSEISGTMAPLPRANVDTDQIIPKQFLKRVERSGFGPYLFYDWARDAEGELDPEFVLNQERYADAAVLVAGPNFGSGSSREHAPWALEDRGFRAIIAPSFADIFRGNCHKIGLLPIELAEGEIDRLMTIASGANNWVTIDLEKQTVVSGDLVASFDIDLFVKHCLLNGLDQIALSMQYGEVIADFEAARPTYRPTLR